MLEVSDLTRDIRPSLKELLIDSIKETLELDINRDEINVDVVKRENETFYYRVLILFTQKSILYYTNEEVELWSRTELLKEAVLPKIEGYDLQKGNL